MNKYKVNDIITDKNVIYEITEVFYDYELNQYCYCVCGIGFDKEIDECIKTDRFYKIGED